MLPKAWKTACIESKGDYRDESFLEEYIGGPLYAHQSQLPSLPIPSLDQTITRLLPTVLPVTAQNEQPSLISASRRFASQARPLQDRLMQRQQDFGESGGSVPSSWLQQWWNQLGYLQVRDPVVVNVSYFFSFVDDATLSPTSSPNVARAATLLYAAAKFRTLVATGQLPVEQIGRKQKTTLCATAYKYMFHACRIPRPNQDTYRIYDPSRHTHAIVVRKGIFFAMELLDANTHDPLPLRQLEDQLQACITQADDIVMSSSHKRRCKLGLLTSGNRDEWADARTTLLQHGGLAMERALERLESGCLVINLDDESPISRQELGDLYWTGSLSSGHNRWFDKSLQLMVTNNGKAGLIAEHSMMDGMPVINFADFVTKYTYKQASQESSYSTSRHSTVVEDIFGAALEQMESGPLEELETHAWQQFHDLISKHVLHAQSFQGYGSSYIKQSGFPPDAFVQMAMQLATYRLFGEQVGTYEATQVRPFRHGRTEVTRTVSVASADFLKAMGQKRQNATHVSDCQRKLELLKRATKSHAQYTSQAAKAQGVDRHLFGLSMMVQEGEKAPDLLSHPAFARSKKWRCSTSQLSHPRFNLWGYGEVVADGVGLAYSILPRSCVFCITALREQGWTDKLAELLEESLLEMRDLIEQASATSGGGMAARSRM